MYQLRNYQSEGKNLLYRKIKEGKKKIIYWSPTGTGKGLAMSDIAKDITDKGKKCIVILRRRELIFQTRENFEKYHKHLPSVIMGTEKGYLHWAFIQVCSIDTIRIRMKQGGEWDNLKTFDVIIIDECHDTNSPTYQTFFEWIDPDKIKVFIGFTATPFSIGGKPLLTWEDVVQPLTAAEARDRGFLVPDITYAPACQINLAGLELNSVGEYKEEDLFKRATENELVGDIIQNWIDKGENRPTLLFGINKDHIRLMCAAFLARGINAMCVDDSTTSADRALIKEKSRKKEIQVVCSVGVLTTGADWPWLSCLILARCFVSSLVLYIQSGGRGLRPYKVCATCGTEYGGDPECFRCKSVIKSFEKVGCIIFDHGGNVIRHGLLYDDRKAKLAHKGYEDKSRNNEAPNIRISTCQNCFAIYSPILPCCPQCGVANKPSLVIKEKSGELKLIDEETMRKLQLNQCLSTLHELQIRKGWYNWKEAAVWFHLHKARGDLIFQFEKELGLPWWLKSKVGIHEVVK
jgi:DNA repair protein RadD